MRRQRFRLPLPNHTLLLGERTLLMGILNVTPDSFSEGGTYFARRAAIARGFEIAGEGADILDLGGESTRPGAAPVSAEEELDRTIPVIEALRRKGLKIPISIDTCKAAVASRALEAGAEIVNDVSGLRYDASLAAVVSKQRAGIILMHLRGTPRTMQQLPPVERVIPAISRGLAASVRRALAAGIAKGRIVLDPGIGFGKSVDQNFEILGAGLRRLARMGYPTLVGPSRKFFIRKTVERLLRKQASPQGRTSAKAGAVPPAVAEEVLFGTAAAVTAAILNGAHIVRVHDVRQMRPVVLLADRLTQ